MKLFGFEKTSKSIFWILCYFSLRIWKTAKKCPNLFFVEISRAPEYSTGPQNFFLNYIFDEEQFYFLLFGDWIKIGENRRQSYPPKTPFFGGGSPKRDNFGNVSNGMLKMHVHSSPAKRRFFFVRNRFQGSILSYETIWMICSSNNTIFCFLFFNEFLTASFNSECINSNFIDIMSNFNVNVEF